MDAINVPISIADRLLAVRLIKATDARDALQLHAVAQDIAHNPTGGWPVMVAESDIVCQLGKALDGEQWPASLDRLLLDLTQAVEREQGA